MDPTELLGRRRVLGLLVAGELAVVGVLGAVAWHAWQLNQLPVAPPASPVPRSGTAPPSTPSAAPTVGVPAPSPTATPGLQSSPSFLQGQAQAFSRDEAYLEGVEWKIVHAVMDGASTYIHNVVLPAIARAQREGSRQ
ncbi:MAG: hypothetical protein J2P45_11310 [Candidatus Dormibacteraeota bacterium]|nr:hypothetical protein [Candidatus Dormibacteraeota bacterium]